MSVIVAATDDSRAEVRRLPGLAVGAAASLGAGAIHAGAIGIHAEHAQLARIFVVMSLLQIGTGLVALWRPGRAIAAITAAVNLAAVGGWLVTRVSGISWIDGLEVSEAPQLADTACALLGAIAAGGAIAALLIGWREGPPVRMLFPSLAVAVLVVPAMWSGSSHSHAEGDHAHSGDEAAAAHDHTEGEAATPHDHDGGGSGGDGSTAAAGAGAAAVDESQPHSHDEGDGSDAAPMATDHADDDDTSNTGHDHPVATAAWPRPWDPTQPIDVSGVPGVTTEQEVRAVELIQASLAELPKYADPAAAIADGYASIGDAGTGSEHYIKGSLIEDDVMLDASQPESLVYTVDGDKRTLAGAMYIASNRPVDDSTLTDYAGPLMQWHIHDNLCWEIVDGKAVVVGLIDANGNCSRGVRAGGGNPMVHVWVTPHPCGVFAALEGVGAGSAAVPEAERVDMCTGEHDHGDSPALPEPVPYDPTKPIDLGGVPGVTPEQQAAAENLVAVNIVRLPQWADYKVAEAAGFKSIGDSITGHEHFVKWDWINDDVYLDPDHPESLVYEPQPDGSKKLVSAMYMLPDTVNLEDVPDIGGPLMQWHIHDNLCYTNDPDHPRVAGLTSADGTCPDGLIKHDPAPMIHVWITSHPCGPFASLEGVGAGQIEAGEERLCDTAHGSH